MEQTVTLKLHLLPDAQDHQILHDTMHVYRDACSEVSDYIFRTHDLNQRSIHEHMYRSIREKFRLGSQMSISCARSVLAAYRTIRTSQRKTGRIQWLRPSFRKPQCDLVWNRDYSINKDETVFSINTLKGRIKVPFHREGFEAYFQIPHKFGTAKLVYKHGKFFLHVPVTYEIEALDEADVTNVVGVDRGIRFLATTYDSNGKTVFYSGADVKQKRVHYKELRRQLQQVRTPSSRRRLKAVGSRENRWMQDVNHCISKALVENNPHGTLFVLEDLEGIRAVTERVRTQDRYVQVSWSYYDLEQKLTYKALRSGQLVIKVDPRYTSQTCPKCGHTEAANRNKAIHTFQCRNCGYRSNDDRIGAMNLHRKGIEHVSTGCSGQGACSPAGVSVNVP